MKEEAGDSTELNEHDDQAMVVVNQDTPMSPDSVNEKKVEEACNEIRSIREKHAESAIKETGEYLIKEFFDGDLEKAKGKGKVETSPNGSTLNRVLERLSNEDNSPSKSWLYRAIDYVIQEEDLKKALPDSFFYTCRKITVSHKVVLLSVTDLKKKAALLTEVENKKLSVRDLKERIVQLSGSNNKKGLLSLISRPEKMVDDEHSTDISLESLRKLSPDKLKPLPEKINKMQDDLNAKIAEIEKKAQDYRNYIEKYNELKSNVETAIKDAKDKSTHNSQQNNA